MPYLVMQYNYPQQIFEDIFGAEKYMKESIEPSEEGDDGLFGYIECVTQEWGTPLDECGSTTYQGKFDPKTYKLLEFKAYG